MKNNDELINKHMESVAKYIEDSGLTEEEYLEKIEQEMKKKKKK